MDDDVAVYVDAAPAIVDAWLGGETASRGGRWWPLRTDGSALWIGSECLAAWAADGPIAVMARRRYSGHEAFARTAVLEELARRGVDVEAVLLPWSPICTQPDDLVRGWQLARMTTDWPAVEARATKVAGAIIDAWLVGRDLVESFLMHQVWTGFRQTGVWVLSECILTRAPTAERLSLVSARRYRLGASNLERCRRLMRDAIRAELQRIGYPIADVLPASQGSRQATRPELLVAGWELTRLLESPT